MDAVHLVGPADPILRDQPLPAPDMGDLLGLGELRLTLQKLPIGLLAFGDLVPELQVGCVSWEVRCRTRVSSLAEARSSAWWACSRSVTTAAKKNEQKATVALNACRVSIFSSSVPARKGPTPLAAAHEATTTTSKAAGAAPVAGITRNIRCGSVPIATGRPAEPWRFLRVAISPSLGRR